MLHHTRLLTIIFSSSLLMSEKVGLLSDSCFQHRPMRLYLQRKDFFAVIYLGIFPAECIVRCLALVRCCKLTKRRAHISSEQFSGLSILQPVFSRLKRRSGAIPGYGLPPNVTISHKSTPKDQLEERRNILVNIIQRNICDNEAFRVISSKTQTRRLYSHVTLCCVNVIKQRLYRHPFNRYSTLQKKRKRYHKIWI